MTEIVNEGKQINAKIQELQINIELCQQKHRKYTNEIIKAEREKNRNKNMIDTLQITINSNEQMKVENIKVENEIENVIKHVEGEMVKIQSGIGKNVKLSDLKSNVKQVEKNIETKNNEIYSQSESIVNQMRKQTEQSTINAKQMSIEHTKAIEDCQQLFKASEQRITKINSICDRIKASKVPKYDSSKIKEKSDKRYNADEE